MLRTSPVFWPSPVFWQRVMPKLPWTKNVYFAVTKGKNRIISQAELLGRLSFCGFEIVAVQEMERRFWVVARKVKMPSHSTNPTYGPLVTLNRVGYRGKMVPVYKLRTMHPYSEFGAEFGGQRNSGDTILNSVHDKWRPLHFLN